METPRQKKTTKKGNYRKRIKGKSIILIYNIWNNIFTQLAKEQIGNDRRMGQ